MNSLSGLFVTVSNWTEESLGSSDALDAELAELYVDMQQSEQNRFAAENSAYSINAFQQQENHINAF